ncbi:hypothetical protein V1279_002594 [Bradyrhizobium sp. AZCC 1610]
MHLLFSHEYPPWQIPLATNAERVGAEIMRKPKGRGETNAPSL